jgi:hypothetical protein
MYKIWRGILRHLLAGDGWPRQRAAGGGSGTAMIRQAILVAGVLCGGTAQGGELFRCGSWVVSADMSLAELKSKCGEPTKKSVETQDVYSRAAGGGTIKTGTATVERWVYDRGTRSSSMIVKITDGVITSLEWSE